MVVVCISIVPSAVSIRLTAASDSPTALCQSIALNNYLGPLDCSQQLPGAHCRRPAAVWYRKFH
jgi:hypothetical protein